MAETEDIIEHKLTRQHADGMEDSVIPEGPDMTDNAHTLVCKEIMAEMKIEHDKYEKIVKKIKTSIHQLFLVKCKVEKGEYYFLAEYKSDGFNDYFGKNSGFGEIQQCMHDNVMTNRPGEKERLNKLYGSSGGRSLVFKFLHNNKDVTIKIGPPNKRTISYEDFKNSFIPINDAFMYENMPKTIDATNIVGMNLLEPPNKPPPPPPVPGLLPPPPTSGAPILPPVPPTVTKKADAVDLTEEEEEEFSDVNEGDINVVDIEQKEGGRKKRRKKGSRSKKRRGRRKNSTKKN